MIDSTIPPPIPKSRPPLVWVIFILYLAIVAWSFMMQILMRVGALPMPPGHAELLRSLRWVDYVSSYVVVALQLFGVTLLWLLRRQALPVLTLSVVLSAANVVRNIVKPGVLDIYGKLGVAGAIGGVIAIAGAFIIWAMILAYTWTLRRRGVLQ